VMLCAPGSTCLLECKPKALSCNLDCQGGQKRDCGPKLFTCNRPCP
jgi:hypothetical protein